MGAVAADPRAATSSRAPACEFDSTLPGSERVRPAWRSRAGRVGGFGSLAGSPLLGVRSAAQGSTSSALTATIRSAVLSSWASYGPTPTAASPQQPCSTLARGTSRSPFDTRQGRRRARARRHTCMHALLTSLALVGNHLLTNRPDFRLRVLTQEVWAFRQPRRFWIRRRLLRNCPCPRRRRAFRSDVSSRESEKTPRRLSFRRPRARSSAGGASSGCVSP